MGLAFIGSAVLVCGFLFPEYWAVVQKQSCVTLGTLFKFNDTLNDSLLFVQELFVATDRKSVV